MSLIPHGFLPRSMFDMDMWLQPSHLGPSTLDFFDPFDDLDRMMGRNFLWLNKPDFLTSLWPRVPNKYRIRVDCTGFSSNSVKTEISEDKTKLIVSGKEAQGNRNHHEDDFSHREFRRTYKLPANVELDKMASFMTSNNQLIVEIPLKDDSVSRGLRDDQFPRIVDDGQSGKKSVEMNMLVPDGLDPSKIKVTCKDRDVIIQAEDKQENQDRFSQTYYYRRCTLPENTNFNSLKCEFDHGNQLKIRAPLDLEYKSNNRAIPIETKNKL